MGTVFNFAILSYLQNLQKFHACEHNMVYSITFWQEHLYFHYPFKWILNAYLRTLSAWLLLIGFKIIY